MKIGAVIQARMGSSRLPGKVLRPIAGLPLLAHVTGRLALLKTAIHIVVATSTESQDDAIVTHCRQSSIACFRGSESDVLARYAGCAAKYDFDHIIRLTADNPFTDIEELDRLMDLHVRDGNDYTHSFGELPIGVGAEVFSRTALIRSEREGHAQNHREHVNEYIQENPRSFRIGVLMVPLHKRFPGLSLTVDTEADYVLACCIACRAAERWISTAEAISYARNSR
jgi:spore coat polysaccharide biosynthesis protein SpsF